MKALQKRKKFWVLAVLVSLVVAGFSIFLAVEKSLVARAMPEPDYLDFFARAVAWDIHQKARIPTFVRYEPGFVRERFLGETGVEEVSLDDKLLQRGFTAVGRSAEFAEVLIAEHNQALLVIFYRHPKQGENSPLRRLDPANSAHEFGRIHVEFVAWLYAYPTAIKKLRLEGLSWRSAEAPHLVGFCSYVPTFAYQNGKRVAMPRVEAEFTAELRHKAAFRLRLMLQLLWLPPSFCLLACVCAFFELRSGYRQFCGQDLSGMARSLEREFGGKYPLPSIWAFLRADAPALYERTGKEFRHLKRALARAGDRHRADV